MHFSLKVVFTLSVMTIFQLFKGRLVDRHQVSTTNLTREVDPQQTNIMKLPAEQKKIIICLRT